MTGASLRLATFTVTFAVDVAAESPTIVYANVSVPLNSAAGRYETARPPVVIATVPPRLGGVTAVTRGVAPSGSVSFASTSRTLLPLSSSTEKLSFAATGGSSTGVTVIATAAEAVVPAGSRATYVKESAPEKFAPGR